MVLSSHHAKSKTEEKQENGQIREACGKEWQEWSYLSAKEMDWKKG